MTLKFKEGDTVACFPAPEGHPSCAFVGEVMEVREDDQIIVVRVEILQHVPIDKASKLL